MVDLLQDISLWYERTFSLGEFQRLSAYYETFDTKTLRQLLHFGDANQKSHENTFSTLTFSFGSVLMPILAIIFAYSSSNVNSIIGLMGQFRNNQGSSNSGLEIYSFKTLADQLASGLQSNIQILAWVLGAYIIVVVVLNKFRKGRALRIAVIKDILEKRQEIEKENLR